MPEGTSEQGRDLEKSLNFVQARLQQERERGKVLDARVPPIFALMWGSLSGTGLIAYFRITDCTSECDVLEGFKSAFEISSSLTILLFAVLLLSFGLQWVIKAAMIDDDEPEADFQPDSGDALQDHIDWTKEAISRKKRGNVKKSACLEGAMGIISILALFFLIFVWEQSWKLDINALLKDPTAIQLIMLHFPPILLYFIAAILFLLIFHRTIKKLN